MASTPDSVDKVPQLAMEKDIEPSGISTPITPPTPSHPHTKQLRNFLHHSGKRIYVVHTPEHHAKYHKQLCEQHPDGNFELLIHGSAEHQSTIQELHDHHTQSENKLREEHGEVYERFQHVRGELDSLSKELASLTHRGVALDANFSKFGYSAHLRTKDVDGDDSPHASGTSTPTSSHNPDDRTSTALKFFKRPAIRQYFHKGLLWRSANSGEAATFELFADLIYVGVIDTIGERAVEVLTGRSIVEYIIIFSISWKIWADLTMFVNWFEVDDIFSRLCVLFYLICLFGFETNITYGFEETYTSMISFFLAERLFIAIYYIFVAFMVPTIKGTMLYHSANLFVCAALWIGSTHLEYPTKLALIWIAIALDLFGFMPSIWFMRHAPKSKIPWMKRLNDKYFDFFPAVNIEHRTARNDAFVSLVFGYSVLTILYQNHAAMGINAFFGKAVLGLIQAFTFNWIYFDIDHYRIHIHAIRRSWISSLFWVSMHLPMMAGYVLAAGTLRKLVLAHDCSDADPETLGGHFVQNSIGELEDGLRWFYCGGLGLCLLCMAAISLCHTHKRLANARLMKRPRLAIRCCVAVIIICLPLAHGLNSLNLIAITTSLVVFVLLIDIYGNSCEGDNPFKGGFCPIERRKNGYSAEFHISKRKRRQIEKAMKEGKKLDLEDVMSMRSASIASDSDVDLEEKGTKRRKHTWKKAAWHGGHY